MRLWRVPTGPQGRSYNLVRWLSGGKQRFAKSKTVFRPESSLLVLALQFQIRQAITPNRLSSRVLSRHLISYR